MNRAVAFAVSLSFAGILALAAVADGPASYARDVEPIFRTACADCHSADDPKKGLDLSKGVGALVGVASREVAMPLVKPGDPDGSYLWAKLTHTHTEGKGMPRTMFGAKKLPPADLDTVRKWIADGAQP